MWNGRRSKRSNPQTKKGVSVRCHLKISIFDGIERRRKSKIIKFGSDLEKNCQLDETINESISDRLYRILRNWGYS